MTSTELSNSSASNSLEGAIISGRGLTAYEHTLGFRAELLQGGTVLNFGPGLTHLQQQLGERGIPSTIVNLDIIKELYISAHDVVRYGATLTLDVYAGLMEKFGKDTTKLRALQKSFVGVKDKTFVQYDGRKIPFADGSFDQVLALWSTYQIPAEQRETVFRELMRVGKHIHIGPIGKVDFAILMRLAQMQGFDVVACMPTYGNQVKRLVGKGIQIQTPADYAAYMRGKPVSERISMPLIDDLTFTMPGINTKVLRPVFGGSTIILKKRSDATMGEMTGNEVYVGVGKPDGGKPVEPFDRAQDEAPLDKARGETHPVVGAVKKTVAAWWERVGPGGVEKSWVNAHKNILKHIDGEDRQKAFEKSAEGWRKFGKAFGIASTVVDFSLSGVGLVVMGRGLGNPIGAEKMVTKAAAALGTAIDSSIPTWYQRIVGGSTEDPQDPRRKLFGRLESSVPGMISLGTLAAGGPMHATWGLAARVAEFFGTVGAHGGNYVASGKAAEHARAVGGAVNKGVSAATKYAAEHPDEIRKTLKTVEDIRERRMEDKRNQERIRKQEADAQLQREYTMWMDAMDPSLRSYYEQNHQWPPPMAKFLQERESFMKDLRKQQEDGKMKSKARA
ncbi:MAG: class I SAM-dependent methyltransferase [Patescibacteria group bacterium]